MIKSFAVTTRALAGLGICAAVLGGMLAGGVPPASMFHLPEMVIVFGVTFFGMLFQYKSLLSLFIRDVVRLVTAEGPADSFNESMATSGCNWAIAGGLLALLPAGISILTKSPVDGDFMGSRLDAVLTAVLWSAVLSEAFFRRIKSAFAALREC